MDLGLFLVGGGAHGYNTHSTGQYCVHHCIPAVAR